MAVKYTLHKIVLNGNPDTYVGRVESNGTIHFDGIADAIVRQGSSVTRADVLSVFENMKAAVRSLLLQGFKVYFDGLVEFRPALKGVFFNPEDTFDISRHTLTAKSRVSPVMRKEIARTGRVVKMEWKKPCPAPTRYEDTASGERNGQMTPGNIGTLYGHRLKFNADSAEEGIFFTSPDGGTTKVTSIQRNKPKELIFLVPPHLPAGTYHLDVRVGYGEDDIRSGRLETPLLVG